jgi:hypothetical protein
VPNEDRPWPPGVTDPFDRSLSEVHRHIERASRIIELLDEAIRLGADLRLGREAGQRLWRRIEVSRVSVVRIVERDQEIAKDLDMYLRGELDWAAAVRKRTRLRKRSAVSRAGARSEMERMRF